MSYARVISCYLPVWSVSVSEAKPTSCTITVITAMLLHKGPLTTFRVIPFDLIPPLLLETFVSQLGDKGIIETYLVYEFVFLPTDECEVVQVVAT